MTPEELADHFIALPGVTSGTGFGTTPGLRVNGKIFAMFLGGELVVKLPKHRVDELKALGAGPVATRPDRPMKEWVSVPPGLADWLALATESHDFVSDG